MLQVHSLPGGLAAIAITALVLVALLRRAAPLGLIDHPRGRRRHPHPTPVVGGLAMASGVIFVYLSPAYSNPTLAGFVLAATLVVVVGVVDDVHDLRWWWRIGAQVVATLVMIRLGGVQVEQIGRIFDRNPNALGAMSVPVTIVATVGVINALNMADGADGVAGSLSLAAFTMIAAASIYVGNFVLVGELLPILGAIVAFLWFNVRRPGQPRAATFMGNAGSAFLGFAIVWATFRLTQHTAHVLTPVLAPWFLAPPIIDCLTLIVRRIASGHSPFKADRNHMHHLMQDAGLSPGQIALVLTGTSFALGLAAALVVKAQIPDYWLVIAFLGLAIGYYWLTASRSRALAAFRWLHTTLHMKCKAPRSNAAALDDF